MKNLLFPYNCHLSFVLPVCQERLSHLVLLMGGKVQKDYTRHVTHLIAGQVGSTKYNVSPRPYRDPAPLLIKSINPENN